MFCFMARGLRKEVPRLGPNYDGVADVNETIDSDVVLEVGVIERLSRMTARRNGIAHVDCGIASYVTNKEADLHTSRGKSGGTWSRYVADCYRSGLLINDTSEIDEHTVAAKRDAADAAAGGPGKCC